MRLDCFRSPIAEYGVVRPRLEFASAAAYPYTTAEMVKLERVQRAATRMIDGLRWCCYTERLHATGLFPESYRRVRGDIICVRRILHGDMGSEFMEYLPLREQTRTRGHGLTLLKLSSVGLPLRFRLSRRVTNLWNSLPADVMEEVNDKMFKRKLDSVLRTMWYADLS
ncbi:unnamed protein product [Echinostoma caproni]|uniref:START domain-containing protein n=1 Tax=Echinostoma caproni TaxID=27848 RepID=A0A183BDI5_9TREM|nr:unnamed protein product [Echinostoma caproni]